MPALASPRPEEDVADVVVIAVQDGLAMAETCWKHGKSDLKNFIRGYFWITFGVPCEI